jgi:trigger factor
MATVTRENIGLLIDKLVVNISKDDYLPNFDKSLKNYSKNANLPGFRKGMVPAGLVKKMYGQSVFNEEVLKNVEKSLFDYLDTEKLEIFAQPVAANENDISQLDCNNPKDYTFGFEIGLKPEVIPAVLSKATLTSYKIEVTNEMINTELERLQQKHGKMTEPETIDSVDIVLNVTFTKCNENGETEEDATTKDNSLIVKYFTPKYQTLLMGKKKEDTITVKLDEAFEEKELDWVLQDLGLEKNGGATYYKLTITKVGLVTPRELNEEFFIEVFPNLEIKTVDTAKKQLKSEIESYWESQSNNQLQDGVYHYLVDNTTMDFPESFLKKWMQTGREKPSTADEVETEYPQFTKSLKWTLISDKLSKDNALKVEPDEIKDFARKQLMGYMGITALDESHGWVEEYANKMMSDKKFIEETYHRAITEKLFKWATTQVKTNEQSISVDDFTKMMQEHKHEH